MKTCACGLQHSAADWERLHLVGTMDDGEGGTLVLRNCACGSTLAIAVASPSEPATVEPEP